MAQTSLDLRTIRRGTRWVGVLTIDAPGLKAPIDFASDSDLKESLGGLRTFFGLGTETASAASAASRRKVIEKVASQAYAFVEKYPNYMGTSVSWAKDALVALAKSNELLRSARGGDNKSLDTLKTVYAKAKAGDKDAERSTRLIAESASLLDHGRASLVCKVADGDQTGHDVGTRQDLRALPVHVGGLQEMSSLRHSIPTRGDSHDDDHELVQVDPFTATPYQTGGSSLGNR